MNLQGKLINVLGDSITFGSGTSAPEFIYENVLGRLVGAAKVRNYGIGGNRIAPQHGPEDFGEAMCRRYRDMADDADLVLILGGTNDYGHGTAPFGTLTDTTDDTFCGACHVLCRGLIEKYPAARVVIMTPLQRRAQNTPAQFSGHPLIDYVDALATIAGSYSIPVLDLYRTAGICPDIPAHQAAFAPDGLHPNDAGAARMAERIAAYLSVL